MSQCAALVEGLPPFKSGDILHDTRSDVTNGHLALTHTYSDAIRNNDYSVICGIVVKSIKDSERQILNVIVTGIPETTDDARAFSDLCEQHLTIKPSLSQRGVVCLGTMTSESNRPRRLLVHLSSEHAATKLLRSAKTLRRSNDKYIAENVYLNADMTRQESKEANERRVKRRQAASISANTVSGCVDQPMSTSRRSTVRTFYPRHSQGAADSRAGGQLLHTMHGSGDYSRPMLSGDTSAQGRPVSHNLII